MKLYKALIKPESNFSTTLRGDTLFGQLCWSIVLRFGEQRLSKLLASYDTTPFVIISDPFAPGYLPKPTLPISALGVHPDQKKDFRKKKWISPANLHSGNFGNAISETDTMTTAMVQVHNSLDYTSFNTSGDTFAPYSTIEYRYMEHEIYVMIDESMINPEDVHDALKFIGNYGYGKDQSIGKGRFSVTSFTSAALAQEGDLFMTLGPCSLENADFEKSWYEPFVRFGKHGASRAHQNAFKRPILFADTGATVKTKTKTQLTHIGTSLRNVSLSHPDTVHQGYAIVTAIKADV